MILSLLKIDFSPWELCLQHGKTGVMLHFFLESSSETLATKRFTLFFPLLFGAPYKSSFSVYALGKKVDSVLLPNDCFSNEIQAQNTVSDLLKTIFSMQLCLGIYDVKWLKTIKIRQPTNAFKNDSSKTYEVDSKFVLFNHYGEELSETISANPKRPCKGILFQFHAEKCQNCTILLKNTNLFH